MNRKLLLLLPASVLLAACAAPARVSNAPSDAEPAARVEATDTERALQNAFNESRRRAGKSELPVSSSLTRLAREESAAAAAAGQLPSANTDRLLGRSGFGTLGKLQGTLKDRGPATGAGFIDYWSHDDPEMMRDDWSAMGTGVAKSADGRLFAIVLVARQTAGGMLMSPAAPAGGLMRN